MFAGVRLSELTGVLLVGVILCLSVAEYGGSSLFAGLAGVMSVTAILLGIGRLRRAYLIFIIIGISLGVIAWQTRTDWTTGVGSAIKSGSLIIGIFTALAALRSAAIRSAAIIECGRFLARQPPGRRYIALTIGGHLFGLILLYGSIALLGSLATESTSRETNAELRYHRNRRMILAVQRGFISTLAWSPMAFPMIISTTLVAGASWNGVVLPCLVNAAVLLIGGWILDIVFKPKLSQPPPLRIAETGSWIKHLWPLLVLLATVIGSTAFVHFTLGIRVIGAIMSLVPLIAVGWVVIQATEHRKSPSEGVRNYLDQFVFHEAPGFRGEITLLFMAAFIGSLGSFLIGPIIENSGFNLAAIPTALLMIGLLWGIVLAGQIGMNPILAVSLFVPFLPAPEAMGISPAVVVTAITAGWALSGATSPFTASVLLVSSLGGVSPRKVGQIWNGLYMLIIGIILSLWVFLLSVTL